MAKGNNKIRRIGIFALAGLLVAAVLLTFGVILKLKNDKIIFKYDDLGVPYNDLYGKEQVNSRLSEDMTVFDGRLYVGGGDYDTNTGPVYVMSYDIAAKKWEQSSSPLPDEQIKRFRVLDGKLVTLGTDPREDWELGNYYLLESGEWKTLRKLPSGIHCFDAVEWENEIFFGLGVNSGDYPAVRFDGESYTPVEFHKDGAVLDTSPHEIIRVYNLFTYKGQLFAFLTLDENDENGETALHYMELYVYNGEVFDFVSGRLPACDLPDVVTSGDSVYLIMNDKLFKTQNLLEFSAVKLTDGAKVSDIIKHDGKIYLLAWRDIGKKYFEIMIFEESDQGFRKQFGFFAQAAAGSFCKDGNDFYVSLGRRDPAIIRDVGKVVRVREK